MSKFDAVIEGLTERGLKALDQSNFTDEEWESIYSITELLVEAELLDRAGLDTGAEVLMLKAALQNFAIIAEIRAGKAVRLMLKEAVTAALGGLGALVKGLLV